MKIIIIGAGKVGLSLVENLSKENNDIVVIDENQELLGKIEEKYDVMGMDGNGISTKIMLDAGIKDADLLIAVTNSDEINMLCCLTGKKMGVTKTIARVRDPEYANEIRVLKEELDINMVINPEQAAADEVARYLSFSTAFDVESFAKGRVNMVGIKVDKASPLAGIKIKELPGTMTSSIIIGAVTRKGEVIVPNGEFSIMDGDNIYIIGKSSSVYLFCKYAGECPFRIKNLMLIGGGKISYYVAKQLSQIGIKVKIIEKNLDVCDKLSGILDNTLIIHGDGTDEEFLKSENIEMMDAFVSMTGMDEENIMAALIAEKMGIKKIIAKINRLNYINIAKRLGINSVICPKLITTNKILKFIRGKSIESLYKIIEGQAEILEFIAEGYGSYLHVPLKKLNLSKDVIIATIVRKDEVVIPHGDDYIEKDDRVIVIAKNSNFYSLEDLILKPGGLKIELQNSGKKLRNIINM